MAEISPGAGVMPDGRAAPGESDTCRICRGEGTESEPLFYPCKCSGSIKFVHQECLMEWLSHSQKKYCELCKTPFRFTKLYHPLMPSTLPTAIFLRHLITRGLKTLVTWARFVLVAFVWLGLLPWAMREVWRFLFWVADGGWASWDSSTTAAMEPDELLEIARQHLANSSAPYGEPSTMATPSSPSSSARRSAPLALDPRTALPPFLAPVSETLNMTSDGQSPIDKLLRMAIGLAAWTSSQSPSRTNQTMTGNISLHTALSGKGASFLSNVSVLGNLTKSPRVNRLIVDVLEGQLITLMVVVALILVFLIREWVVQQRPEMQMGGDFNAAFAAAPRDEDPPEEAGLGVDEQQVDVANRAVGWPQGRDPRNDADVHDEYVDMIRAVPTLPPHRPDDATEEIAGEWIPTGEGDRDQNHRQPNNYHHPHRDNGLPLRTNGQRPNLPDREALSRAAVIRQAIEEGGSSVTDRFGGRTWPMEIFMDLWLRADKDPDRVIRIIEAEGRTEELRWIVEVMTRRSATRASVYAAAALHDDTDLVASGHPLRVTNPDPLTPVSSNEPEPSSEAHRSLPGEGESWEEQEQWWTEREEKEQHWKRNEKSWEESWDIPDLKPTAKGKQPETTRSLEVNSPNRKGSPEGSAYHTSDVFDERDPWDDKGKGRLKSSRSPYSNHPERYGAEPILGSGSPAGGEESHEWSPPSVLRAATPSTDGDPLALTPESSSCQDNGDSRRLPTSPSDRHTERALGGDKYNVRQTETTQLDEPPMEVPPTGEPQAQGPQIHERQPAQPPAEVAPAAIGDGRPAAEHLHPAPGGLLDWAMDWLWGDVLPQGADAENLNQNDERVVRDINAEAPFVPVVQADVGPPQPILEGNDLPENAPAAEADANDPDAIEEGEDFDGVLDLVGMRGPLTGLFQNMIFSAVLISTTVAGGIWLPYIWGKVVLLVLGRPVSLFVRFPLRCFTTLAELLVDLTLFTIGSFVHWTDQILRLALTPLVRTLPILAIYTQSTVVTNLSRSIAERGLERIARIIIAMSIRFSETDYPLFSILCHESLQQIKRSLSESLAWIPHCIGLIYHGELLPARPITLWTDLSASLLQIIALDVDNTMRVAFRWLAGIESSRESSGADSAPFAWARLNAMRRLIDTTPRTLPLDPDLAYWGTGDRIIAIIAGYAFFSLLGALYLKRGRPFSTAEPGKRVEGLISDALQQAGGVLKVILIISIEMIAFPLYCGMLLDLALLPLFEQATTVSRVVFTAHSPWTSAFVHWFVGTCYMFHFALFVSMCRKICRSGVLYFIRDPDDPTFHPVRDVLERNVVTQLKKITFSALVYGGLVIICLGGVVWSLHFGFDRVLPIHWSSNEPVLEFPVDLLFYNFLMPLAVKFFKPSDGLHAMYTWWFRKCARLLRLSWFLFGERRKDEEGRHVRRTWRHLLSGKRGDPEKPVIGEDRRILAEDRNLDAYFLRDGRYVRSPASDQVRIPRGGAVFLEVDENGSPLDSEPEEHDGHRARNDGLFVKVYVPPWFWTRIALFVLLIWLFAALTGVGLTIVPLVIGRRAFATLFPHHLRVNDVYAFSIGIYLLGGSVYLAVHYDRVVSWVKQSLSFSSEKPREALHKAYHYGIRGVRLIYTYAAFGIVLPSLFALLMEFYVIIPLHTALASDQRHMIHFVQDWTLGVLYVKMAGRLILWYSHTRPAEALRAVMREGWTNPDVRVATRCFILPACVVMLGALLAPLPLGWVANTFWYAQADPTFRRQVYRYSYPAVLATFVCSVVMFVVGMMFERWRRVIKDEVYLIGERLHNFGERRIPGQTKAVAA